MDNPTSYIPLGLAIIAGLIWLIRLEGKVNAAISTANDVSKDYYDHKVDRDIHPSTTDLDRRFNEFHADLGEIKQNVASGFFEVNRRLDAVLRQK